PRTLVSSTASNDVTWPMSPSPTHSASTTTVPKATRSSVTELSRARYVSVERAEAGHAWVEAELGAGARRDVVGSAARIGLRRERGTQCVCERPGRTDRHDGVRRRGQLGYDAHTRADDGNTTRGSLDGDHALSFVTRRQHTCAARPIHPRQGRVIDVAPELHGLSDAKLGRQPLEVVSQGPIADDVQRHVGNAQAQDGE